MPANHGQAPKFKDTVYYSEYMHASRRRGTGVVFFAPGHARRTPT